MRRLNVLSYLWVILAVGSLGWLLLGCGGGSSKGCKFDGDCAAGQVCLDRQCVTIGGCQSDADCQAPLVCRGGQCINETQCEDDGDCTPPQVCLNGRCMTEGGCQIDADCEVPLVCVDGDCVDQQPGDFVLRVTDSPVEDGQAQLVVEELDPDFIPVTVELYLDGELFVTPKTFMAAFTLDTLSYSNGRHDVRLQLTDEAGTVLDGQTSFTVQNPSVEVIAAETPVYAYPGQTLDLWLEVTGPLDRIEPDFSAIDDGFAQNQIEDRTEDGRHRISYDIPQNPTGGEGSYDIPIAVIASDGSEFVYRGLSFYLGGGPLMPFESEDGIRLMESIPAEGAPDAALFVTGLNIEQASIITGGMVDIDLQFEGDTNDGRVLIGLEGWGGHLLIPISSMQPVGDSYRLTLYLPEESIEGEVEFRFQAVAMDSDGRIGIDQRRRRLFVGPIPGIFVPKGALQIKLTWPKATRPDIDLHVVEPNNVEIYWEHKRDAQCDSNLDLDANSRCPSTGLAVNREVYNAYLPVAGDYQVKVDYYDDCDHTGPVTYTVTVEGCGTSWQTTGTTPADPDHGSAGSGQLVHSFHCNGHYWVEGQAKYLYWKMRNHTAAGDTGIMAKVPFKLYDSANGEIPVTPNSNSFTDSRGKFRAAFELDDAKAAQPVTLKFVADDTDVTVYKTNTNDIHEYAHPQTWKPKDEPKKTLPLLTVPLHDSAAFHVFQVMKRARQYYTSLLKNWNTNYPKVRVETLRDVDPPCGSCFSPGTNRFYLLGDYSNDGDYYDDAVMLHELGHYVMSKAAYDHSPGGGHSWHSKLVPEFAWSEGIATYLGQTIVEANASGQGKYYCDRSKAGDNCSDFTDLAATGIPTGTSDGKNTGRISEALVLAMMWDLRDKDDDGGKDPVAISEGAFLKWVFDKTAANKTNTMQDSSNWDKGTNAKADGSDLMHLYGCPLTESTTPKLSQLKKLMKDRLGLGWYDEANFCK